MNTNIQNDTKVKSIVAMLARHTDGRKLADLITKSQPRLLKVALEKGLNASKTFSAIREALEVYAFEASCGVNAEVSNYGELASDVFALCDSDYLPAEEEMVVEHEEVTVDEAIDSKRKEWVYDFCMNTLVWKMMKKGLSRIDAEDIVSGAYSRLMSKRVTDAFSRGIPQSDAEWAAFLKKDAQFAFLNYHKEAWRHPTCSLDEPIMVDGCEEEGDELSRLDALDYDTDCIFQPNRKDDFLNTIESRHELQYVRKACDLVWRKYKKGTRSVLKKLLFDEAEVEEVSEGSGKNRIAIYVAKNRGVSGLRECGPSALAQIEALAA